MGNAEVHCTDTNMAHTSHLLYFGFLRFLLFVTFLRRTLELFGSKLEVEEMLCVLSQGIVSPLLIITISNFTLLSKQRVKSAVHSK